MLDKIRFMEMLQAITEIAKTQENYLTQKEIRGYFGDMDLEEEHYQHIYQYLGENKITVEGFIYKPIAVKAENTEETGSEESEIEKESVYEHKEEIKKEQIKEEEQECKAEDTVLEEDSLYLKMYLEDISCLNVMLEKETEELVEQLRQGNQKAKERLMEGYLHHVVTIAKEYTNRGINIEDLIQEGNIGLMQAIDTIGTITNSKEGDAFLKDMIKNAIETFIDEEMADMDWENAVIAKTNLISEAAKYLAEDYGRVATIKELSSYTKLSEEEIQDILQLSLDAVSIGKGQ